MKYEIRSMKCMRRCFGLVMVLALTGLAGAWAGEADDHYIEIYKLIREADALNEGGQLSQAQTRYTEALASLQTFRKTYPDWNVLAVNYRLEYLASKIAGLAAKLPAPSAAAPTPANAPAAPNAPAPGSGPAPVSADWTNQFNALREQARQWQLEKNQWLADRALLEAKLKEALAIQPAASDPRELAKAEAKINALQKENDLLSASLERAKAGASAVPAPSPAPTPAPPAEAARPKQPEKAPPREPGAAPAPSVDAGRLKQLEWQRDDLAKKLAAANKALAARKAKGSSLAETQNELNNLRAKLEVLEAQKVPYSAEELALFKPSEPTLATARPARKPVREVPAGMAALVAQARNYFFNKQYDKAEALYLQVLREDEKNIGALSDLAFIQVKLQHFEAAEKHLKSALAIAPDDPYSLMILGRLRMSQTNYDDALQMLSRAAQGDPQNAEIQNELGIVLTEKGQRAAAEAAFRKAILLLPGYADAHENLAFFYLTQQPPLVELARWHYQKALAAGGLHNAEIEKLFESKKAAAR